MLLLVFALLTFYSLKDKAGIEDKVDKDLEQWRLNAILPVAHIERGVKKCDGNSSCGLSPCSIWTNLCDPTTPW